MIVKLELDTANRDDMAVLSKIFGDAPRTVAPAAPAAEKPKKAETKTEPVATPTAAAATEQPKPEETAKRVTIEDIRTLSKSKVGASVMEAVNALGYGGLSKTPESEFAKLYETIKALPDK